MLVAAWNVYLCKWGARNPLVGERGTSFRHLGEEYSGIVHVEFLSFIMRQELNTLLSRTLQDMATLLLFVPVTFDPQPSSPARRPATSEGFNTV